MKKERKNVTQKWKKDKARERISGMTQYKIEILISQIPVCSSVI